MSTPTPTPALRSVAPSVDAAVSHVVRSLTWLTWSWRRVVLVRRGDDRFWERLCESLDRAGVATRDVALPVGDRMPRYHPDALAALEAAPGPGDLVIHHDPCVPAAAAGGCDDVRALLATGAALVALEFPAGPLGGARLREAYLRALSEPVSRVDGSATAAARAIRTACVLAVHTATTRLAIGGAVDVAADRTAPDRGHQVLQLPLGEVWLLPDPAAVTGTVQVQRGQRRTDQLRIEGGHVVGRAWSHGRLVEVGIGLNPRAAALPTALGEKARGRLHLGFGDADLIGGTVTGPSHVDLYLSRDSRLIVTRPGAGPADLGDLLEHRPAGGRARGAAEGGHGLP